MARVRDHANLDADKPLFVKRQSLTVGGKTLSKDAPFPWRDLGVSQRKLRQLHDLRAIGHEPSQEPPASPKSKRARA
jgi:hypothetical protein